uniref:CRAL-TRIO domain-containing protein n=1 Tax=Populus trichocarpa TaxID=3694 RepID=A0A2K2B811_POPTR
MEFSNIEESNGVITEEKENGNEINEIEQSKVRLMRAFVEREDPSVKEVDDLMIRRFLRARELDIEKASTLFQKYLSWRRSFIPNGFIAPSEIPNELAQNKFFMQGADKQNRPVVVVFGARHKPYKGSFEEFKPGEEKFVSIADLKGWGYSNSDIRGYLAALSILQDCYPERLGKLFIVHVPYIFMTAWKVVSPFIDRKTKNKIIFVENKKLKSTLLEDIDESQLPDVYGGKLSLVPIQDD